MSELILTVLELFAIVFISVGLGAVVAALIGGYLGAGVGGVISGLAILGAAELSRRITGGEGDDE